MGTDQNSTWRGLANRTLLEPFQIQHAKWQQTFQALGDLVQLQTHKIAIINLEIGPNPNLERHNVSRKKMNYIKEMQTLDT